MILRGEAAWGGVATPASGSAAERAGSRPAPGRAAGARTGARPGADSDADRGADTGATAIDDLEAEVYAARDLNDDDRREVRRTFTHARSQMSEATYRRALTLARDSVLLSIEECISGALAMEWEPLPRPEFTLATIEAAVAEQERSTRDAERPQGRTA